MNARPLAVTLAFLLPVAASAAEPRLDLYGDTLPEGAVARLGTLRFRTTEAISEVRVSPDGKRIAARGNGRLMVFDAGSGRILCDIRSPGPFGWLPDGRGALLLPPDRYNPRLVDAADAGLIPSSPPRPGVTDMMMRGGRLVALSELPTLFAFSPDGFLLAAAVHNTAGENWTVALRRVAVGKRFKDLTPVRTLGSIPGDCYDLLFTRDGRSVGALYSSDDSARDGFALWDVATGQQRYRGTVPTPARRDKRPAFALSPDGTRLAVGLEEGTVQVFDLPEGEEPRPVGPRVGKTGPEDGVWALAFSPDGRLLVAARGDHTVQGWDAATLRETWPAKRVGEPINTIDFSPDGKRVVTAGWTGVVRQWDAAIFEEVGAGGGHRGMVHSVAVSADGRTAVTAGVDGTLRVWDLGTGRPRRRIDVDGYMTKGVALAPDGRTALLTADNSLSAWDVTTGEAHPLPGGLTPSAGYCHGFGPDGRTLVLAGRGPVSLWDWPPGPRPRSIHLVGQDGQAKHDCYVAALSPDGGLLAVSGVRADAGSTEQVPYTEVWDTSTGKQVARLDSGVTRHISLCFVPSGRAVIAAGWRSRTEPDSSEEESVPPVGLWDPRTGKLRYAFGVSPPASPQERRRVVRSAVLSPDGRTLAVAEANEAVLYEVTSGQERRRLTGHRAPVTGLAFTPDGGRLVTASADQTALVWDVTLAAAAPPAGPVTEADRRGLWAALSAGPAQAAYEAMARLAADPPAAVAFLRERLRPAVKLDRAALDRVFADLESDRFATRQRAAAELDRLGKAAVEPARERLKRTKSEDGRDRLQRFLDKQAQAAVTPEELRQARAVELLDVIGSPEARALLRELAAGEPEAALTRDAAESLRRLEK